MFFQMDDGFDSEPRVLRAGTAAFGLYARCGLWVSRNLTDGFVPAELAASYGTREWIERLVDAGLWVRVDGGFTMPDYLEPGRHRNWSRERIEAHRAGAAERQAKARAGKAAKTRVTRDVTRDSHDSHTGSHGVSHSAPSHPPLKGDGGAPATRGGRAPSLHLVTTSEPCEHGAESPARCAFCRTGRADPDFLNTESGA